MRNATLESLVGMLGDQHARKIDLVVPGSQLRIKDAQLVVAGAEWVLDEDGVTDPNGTYTPTAVFDEGLAAKLGIPIGYVRKMREQAPDLFDANMNGWLRGKSIRRAGVDEPEVVRAAEQRKFLVRLFRGKDGEQGVARALLSDSFGLIENFDVVVAALKGIEQAGVEIDRDGIRCDLSDRRMFMRVSAPEVAVRSKTLLSGYRNPFADPEVERERNHGWDMQRAREAAEREGMKMDDEQVVFGGFEIRNSEVGQGHFEIVPVLEVKVCRNGLTITREAFKRRHVGSKLEEGTIQWSADTVAKANELIVAKTRDAVQQFLSVDFVQATLDSIEEQAGTKVREPEQTIQHVAKTLSFSEGEMKGVLAHFIRGGQMTAGGVLNAVTSYSQTVANADRAHDLDDLALRAMELAAAR